MQLSKKVLPNSSAAMIVYNPDEAFLPASQTALRLAGNAGLCITALFEVQFHLSNYTTIVDGILEQTQKGRYHHICVKVKLSFSTRTSLEWTAPIQNQF